MTQRLNPSINTTTSDKAASAGLRQTFGADTMTLSTILDPFCDHDLESLSRKARNAAVGCGQEMSHPIELPFDDWCTLDDIAQSIFQTTASDDQQVATFFEFYERFPGYHALTIMFRWYDDHPALSDSVKSQIWLSLGAMLRSDAALADPVAYSLWVDRFEAANTVVEAWMRLLPACTSEQALRRLLTVSGPVPFDLKQDLYFRLLPEARFHTAI